MVDDPSQILLLAYLFNGNLAMDNRIKQLSLWINSLNNRFGPDTIKFNNNPISITLNDGWLSGFTDAEGCFNVSIIASSRYTLGHVIRMRYILDQKDGVILNKICELFGFGKVTLRSGTEDVYRYTATGFKTLHNVISYFELFPLYTKKRNSLEKWLAIHTQVSNKLLVPEGLSKLLTKEGLAQVRFLPKQINLNNSTTNKTGAVGLKMKI